MPIYWDLTASCSRDSWDLKRLVYYGLPQTRNLSPTPLLTDSVSARIWNSDRHRSFWFQGAQFWVTIVLSSSLFLAFIFYFAMNGLNILRNTRIILHFLLSLICLTSTTLFAILICHEWPYSSPIQKVIIAVFPSFYVVFAILSCLMVVLRYSSRRNVMGIFAALVVHIGGSVCFTHVRHSLPCRGFGTETACKRFTYAIFVCCWAFSEITLCIAIALGVMALVPRPVEPLPDPKESDLHSKPNWIELLEALSPHLNTYPVNSIHTKVSSQGTEEYGLPSDSDSFKAGSPAPNERRTFLSSTHAGLVAYNDEFQEVPLSPGRNACLVDSIHTISQPVESLRGSKDDDTHTRPVTHNNEPREGSLSPDRNTSAVNSVHSILEPPRLWESFQNRNSGFSNESGSRGGTIPMRNTQGGGSSTDSGSQHVSALSPYSSYDDSLSPPVSIYSRMPLSMIRPDFPPRARRLGLVPFPKYHTVLNPPTVNSPSFVTDHTTQ